jgi:membrane protein DedA with SNARE-associated domain/membrane-associated phospholipid phosphatase
VQRFLETLTGLAGPWAYVVVGLLATAEAVLLGLVLPGEVALLIGGFLAYQHRVSLVGMLLVGVAAAVGGFLLGYGVGRRFGQPVLEGWIGRRIGEARWARAQEVLRNHGGWAVFFGRFVGALRALLPMAAGMAGMPLRTFLPPTVAGGLIWAPGFVLIGYLAGGSYQRVAAIADRAGLVLAGLAVVIVAVVVGARWVARHPDKVRTAIARLVERPWVVALRGRYGRELSFLARRLNPQGVAGLWLMLGLLTVVGFGWAFGWILEEVIGREELATRDSPVAAWLDAHRVDWLTACMRVITQLGSTRAIFPLIAAVSLWLLVRRRRVDAAVVLVAAWAGAAAIVSLIKLLIGRAHPGMSQLLVAADGSAFPSGHAAQAVATYGALAYLAARATTRWRWRVAVWTAAGLLALLIGFSRLYLGAHWLTDVLGGWALGAAWLTTVVTAAGTHRRLRAERRPPEHAGCGAPNGPATSSR